MINESQIQLLSFRPIEASGTDLAWQHRRDAFEISFGSNAPTDTFITQEKYQAFIAKIQKKSPLAAVFICAEDKIIGQVELTLDTNKPWVNLYYLRPDYRHKGLGKYLDDYAMGQFRERRMNEIGLRVAIENHGARRFYIAMGWVEAGVDLKNNRLLVYRRYL